jgi:hypothetical protein
MSAKGTFPHRYRCIVCEGHGIRVSRSFSTREIAAQPACVVCGSRSWKVWPIKDTRKGKK